jgi:proteic killer suppression protein
MIRNFADEDTARVFRRERMKRFSKHVQRAALRKLLMLHAAADLGDMRVPPGNRLEKLVGDRKGQHSIRVNDQFRICFKWESGDAVNVELVDHH